jgi:hypothetical protein
MSALPRRPLAALALGALGALFAVTSGCPGTLSLEEKQHLAYDCPDVPSVILARRCANAGCHDADGRAGGLDLASPKLAQRLLGVPASGGAGALVDLRDPESSVLLTKLGDRPPFGARMPSGRPAIDPASYACLHAWVYSFVPVKTPVDAGAPALDAADVLVDDAATDSGADVDATQDDAALDAQDADAADSASAAADAG